MDFYNVADKLTEEAWNTKHPDLPWWDGKIRLTKVELNMKPLQIELDMTPRKIELDMAMRKLEVRH